MTSCLRLVTSSASAEIRASSSDTTFHRCCLYNESELCAQFWCRSRSRTTLPVCMELRCQCGSDAKRSRSGTAARLTMTSAGDRPSPCGVKMAGFIPILFPKNCHLVGVESSGTRLRLRGLKHLHELVTMDGAKCSCRFPVFPALVYFEFVLLASGSCANYLGVNVLNSPNCNFRSPSNTVAVKVNLASNRYVSTPWKYDWNSMFRVVRVFPIRLQVIDAVAHLRNSLPSHVRPSLSIFCCRLSFVECPSFWTL